ncbi:uncharacterized protein DI49_3565 [Saccharomyces eubayanus]|uniref:uncharacterized protein n=1 Tax=Saccharomyces eubayanus TaxID=1080349 RepID=UPI0006C1560E|nr:hypothetical protein DI49_3565 [Saccharomyces eubayanus]KOG97750.1 hypothetical protein DI49_3565 [Saccharomyces eubayanus]
MKTAKEIEPSATINQDEIPKSKIFLFVEKLSTISISVCCGVDVMTPSLHYLTGKYPKVIGFMLVQSALVCMTLLINLVYLFLLWRNGLLKKQNKREPKRCSKVSCSQCNARRQYPRWFKLKHLLLSLATLTFGIYSLIKIDIFFETDQTVDLYRLSQLFGWQLSAICSFILLTFYGNQLSLHNGPLQVNDDDDEKKAVLGMRADQRV